MTKHQILNICVCMWWTQWLAKQMRLEKWYCKHCTVISGDGDWRAQECAIHSNVINGCDSDVLRCSSGAGEIQMIQAPSIDQSDAGWDVLLARIQGDHFLILRTPQTGDLSVMWTHFSPVDLELSNHIHTVVWKKSFGSSFASSLWYFVIQMCFFLSHCETINCLV